MQRYISSYFIITNSNFINMAKPSLFLSKKIYIIAEVAQAHDGSLGNALAYAKTCKQYGCNAVKYQIHIPSEESSPSEKFRLPIFPQDQTRYDYWERTSFTKNQWQIIRNYCKEIDLDFIVSPFSNKAVDWAFDLDVDAIKIGSGDVSNVLMIQKISDLFDESVPVLISSGMSNYKELEDSIKILKKGKIRTIIPMQCTSLYPTKPRDWGLNNIKTLLDKYPDKVGFSDHSGDVYSSLAAVTLGAEVIEAHIVFSKNAFGPDTSSSLTPEQFKFLVNGAHQIKESLLNPINKNLTNEQVQECKMIFQKRIVARKLINKGEIINSESLKTLKGIKEGLLDKNVSQVIGRKSKKEYKLNEPLLEKDFE